MSKSVFSLRRMERGREEIMNTMFRVEFYQLMGWSKAKHLHGQGCYIWRPKDEDSCFLQCLLSGC